MSTASNTASRKTAAILTGIMLAEGIPLAIVLHQVSTARALSFFDPIPAGLLACVLALAIAVAYTAYAARRFPAIRDNFLALSPLKLLAIPFALITGTMEELWFRHQLMDAAAGWHLGLIGQIVVSALLFGAVHAVWGLFGGKLRMAAGAMSATATLGGALAVVYLVGGRQVAPCVLAHVAINLAIEPWLLLSAGKRAVLF